MDHYPRVEKKGEENKQNRGKQPRGFKFVTDGRHNSGKGSKNTRTPWKAI